MKYRYKFDAVKNAAKDCSGTGKMQNRKDKEQDGCRTERMLNP